jgi:two-component system LytT family response regulator
MSVPLTRVGPDLGETSGAPRLRCVLIVDRVPAPLAMLGRLTRHTGIRVIAVLPDHPNAVAEVVALRPDIVFLAPRADAARWTAPPADGAEHAPTTVILADAGTPPLALVENELRRPHEPAIDVNATRRRLIVRDRGGLYVLRDDEIDWVRAEDRHAAVRCGTVVRFVRRSLNAFERALDPNRFVRIHRDFIVRFDRVREMHPMFHGDQELVLHDGTRLPLSRRYVRRFLDLTQLTGVAR